MLKTHLYRFLIFLIGSLPLRVIRRLGALLGSLAWLLRTRMWLVTRQNIELCYPDLDPHRQRVLSKESLQETGKTIAETCFAWIRPPEEVLSRINSVEGKALVDDAHQAGHAIIFIIPHLGNWEIINHYLGQHYGLSHMFQPNRNRRLNSYIQERRSLTGTKFVATDRSGIKTQLKILRSGGCIGMMPDQEPLVHTGEFVQFFGIPALTNELLKGYSRTNCKVFTAVCEREQSGFAVKLKEVSLHPNSDILSVTNSAIEQAIRRQPTQYLWSYKRFRTRPDGQLDYYEINRHPVRTCLERLVLGFYDLVFRHLSPRSFKWLARLTPAPLKRQKITKVNLQLTSHTPTLANLSMFHTKLAVLEAPRIWDIPAHEFSASVSTDNKPDFSQGAMILTPPLGSREAMFKYITAGNRVTEYYHANSIEALDHFIRLKRNAMGVRLVPHDQLGREHLVRALSRNELVTLCPDQQPRLRGGLFADFFGHPGLTTLAIPEVLKVSNSPLYLGYALRDGEMFQINLVPIAYDPNDEAQDILRAVNAALEREISKAPEQYRWSDKRYNIQPVGHKKVYR